MAMSKKVVTTYSGTVSQLPSVQVVISWRASLHLCNTYFHYFTVLQFLKQCYYLLLQTNWCSSFAARTSIIENPLPARINILIQHAYFDFLAVSL